MKNRHMRMPKMASAGRHCTDPLTLGVAVVVLGILVLTAALDYVKSQHSCSSEVLHEYVTDKQQQ